MKIIKHSIIGSGLSALVRDQISNNSIIFSPKRKQTLNIQKSKNFYEVNNLGGNSNIWGGFINLKRHNLFCKNKKYSNFFKNSKIIKIKPLFNNDEFEKTWYISEFRGNKILRVNQNIFKNKIYFNPINKFSISQKLIILGSGSKTFKTRKLSLCIGNLNLIKLLFNSNYLKKKDKVSFDDGNVDYCLNILKNKKKYYYIPMNIKDAFIKLFFNKTDNYNNNISTFYLLQRFSKNKKKFEFNVDQILKFQSNHIRFFLSHHISNLKINNIPIDKFCSKISKRISVYNSGVCKKYYGGPISQDIIFNALK